MDKEQIYKIIISFLAGLVFFFLFYLLERFLGFTLSALFLIGAGIWILLWFMRNRYAPHKSFVSFLEDYADGVSFDRQIAPARAAHKGFSAMPFLDRLKKGIYSAKSTPSSQNLDIQVKESLDIQKIPSSMGSALSPEQRKSAAEPKKPGGIRRIEASNHFLNRAPWEPIFSNSEEGGKSYTADHQEAYAMIKAQNYNRAMILMDKLIRRFPGNDVYLNDQALLQYLTGREEEAFFALQKAALLSFKNSVIHLNLGLLYRKRKKYREAFASFRESLKLQKGPLVYYNLASLYAATGQYAECKKFLDLSRDFGFPVDYWIVEDPGFRGFLDSDIYRS